MSQCQICGKLGEWIYNDQGNRLALVCDNPPCMQQVMMGLQADRAKQRKAEEADKPSEPEE
jgi:hypothetical protein